MSLPMHYVIKVNGPQFIRNIKICGHSMSNVDCHQDNISVKHIPLIPHFYIAKLEYTGVYLFFLFTESVQFLHLYNICILHGRVFVMNLNMIKFISEQSSALIELYWILTKYILCKNIHAYST